MVQVLCFFLPPTIALLFSAIREKEKKPLSIWVAEWLSCAVVLYVGTALALLPFDRVTPRVGLKGSAFSFLYLEYGSMAIMVIFTFGVVLGLAEPMLSRTLRLSWRRGRIEPRKCRMAFWGLIHLLALIMFILTYSYIWGLTNFGFVGLEEIVFHLNVPLKGTAGSLVGDYLSHGIGKAFLVFILFELIVFLPVCEYSVLTMGKNREVSISLLPIRLSERAALMGLALWFVFLAFGANRSFGVTEYITSQLKQSQLIKAEYVDPSAVAITFPQEKRNLITIYVESAETTSMDKENGGIFDVNYTPEMTRIAKENVSFSHSHKLEGAAVAPACGWTIAGLVAETAGLPLKLYNQEVGAYGTANSMGNHVAFMPGATMLGDILGNAGYRLAFMCGSDFTFGGRREMYAQHGGYEVYDHPKAVHQGMIPEDYYEFWGFEDEKLYAWAKEVLTDLSSSEQPFHFAMLTVDTHSPDGYICSLCPDAYDEQFANVLACSSVQLDSFLKWCEQQPFYEDTTIVITGDHASMAPDFYGTVADSHEGTQNRKVYNAFINSVVEPVREENRLFTTMDFFPTTLASIGVQIEGDRLALGTNLFSDRETLSEQYGYEELFKQLSYKSLFYNNEILYP